MRDSITHPSTQSEAKRKRILQLEKYNTIGSELVENSTNMISESVENSTNMISKSVENSTDIGRESTKQLVENSTNYTEELVEKWVENSTNTKKKRGPKKILSTSAFDKLDDLTGMALLVSKFVIENALNNGTLVTDKIQSKQLCKLLINNDYSSHGAKRIIDTLTFEKQIFERHKGRSGPNGYQRFKIDDEMRKAYLLMYGGKRQSVEELVENSTNIGSESVETISSPISSPIGRELVEKNPHLIDRYLSISFIIEPLKKLGFDFTQDHYKKVLDKLKDEEIVKQCLLHVAFGIKNNLIKLNPRSNYVDLFIGTIMKLGVFHAPKGYKSAKQIFLEQQIEQQKAEDTLSQELFDRQVQAWLKTLSEAKKNELLPQRLRKLTYHEQMLNNIKPEAISYLTKHYLQHIKNKGEATHDG